MCLDQFNTIECVPKERISSDYAFDNVSYTMGSPVNACCH